MMGVYIVMGSLLIIILLSMIFMAVSFMNWVKRNQKITEDMYKQLAERIDDTQLLFKTDVVIILSKLKELLK